jgi:hypothetical protein
MASPYDPYRVLGLPAGAPMVEIKRAYRRLAKAYHPDSAGPGAIPRFLAIQEAYDALTSAGGRGSALARPARSDGGVHGPAGPGAGGFRRHGPRPSQEPGPAPFGPRRGSATGGTGQSGHGAGGPDPRTPGGWWQRRARRAPNRAILGSTTYDDAGEPEPEWEGASWYGQATGTYWTINPREYADPRKHGPEYQARAWRLGVAADDSAGMDAGDDELPEAAADE